MRGERTVPVDIPAGISSNNYLTLRGQGAAARRNGPSGDLLIMIEVKEDERFERHGDDLSLDVPLSFTQAALGCTVKVPTPYGEERLTVPAGIQTGTVLRIKGKGLPRLGQHGSGDLNVRVHLWTPEALSPEQRAAIPLLIKRAQSQGVFVKSGLDVRAHREVSATSCPGSKVSADYIQELQKAVNA